MRSPLPCILIEHAPGSSTTPYTSVVSRGELPRAAQLAYYWIWRGIRWVFWWIWCHRARWHSGIFTAYSIRRLASIVALHWQCTRR